MNTYSHDWNWQLEAKKNLIIWKVWYVFVAGLFKYYNSLGVGSSIREFQLPDERRGRVEDFRNGRHESSDWNVLTIYY